MSKSERKIKPNSTDSKPSRRKNVPVFVDFKALSEQREKALGRPLTEQESSVLGEADIIRIDSIACGRKTEETISNIENSGGKVSDAVKAALGLIPPTN